MDINAGNLANLSTGYKASFNTGFRNADSYWEKVATRVGSATSHNTYAWLGQFPRLREWVGDRVVKEMAVHGYKIQNRKFESTIGVSKDTIEDDEYGIYNPLFEEMGYAAKTHPDELLFALIAKGFSEVCYDGQYFFDNDHPVKANGETTSVSNVFAGEQAPWFLLDTRRALKPFIYQDRKPYEFTHMDDPKDKNVFDRDEYLYGVKGRSNVGFGFWQQAFGARVALDRAAFRGRPKADVVGSFR